MKEKIREILENNFRSEAEVVKEESLDVHNILDFIKQNKEKFLIALNNL